MAIAAALPAPLPPMANFPVAPGTTISAGPVSGVAITTAKAATSAALLTTAPLSTVMATSTASPGMMLLAGSASTAPISVSAVILVIK